MLFKLLGLPVSLPVAGLKFCLDKVAELADQELNDPDVIREQLILLQLQLEEGEIEEDEYAEQEAVLFQRLRDLRERRRQLAEEHAAELREEAEAQVSGRRRVIIEADFGEDR